MRKRSAVLAMQVDQLSMRSFLGRVAEWSNDKVGRYVCVSNVHMCIECVNDERFQTIVNDADTVVADGRPIFLAQKLFGAKNIEQLRGYDITLALCELAEQKGLTVGFYGSTENVLDSLQQALKLRYPSLKQVYACSPPFRELSNAEIKAIQRDMNESGCDLLFVGLGCPKQERWMSENKEALNCTLLGVGAVFDFLAGNKDHAPRWLQQLGLEWLFRLVSEPKRLWRRYLTTNPKFLALLAGQLIKQSLRR
ncbi:MAG: WecB/TagA/CpsF family glycosyltransferase [Cellvibrionales bacterium]|nr:WecB/TagA/CpsF family glycosyltransferase [Cellvibrionales bacterium]